VAETEYTSPPLIPRFFPVSRRGEPGTLHSPKLVDLPYSVWTRLKLGKAIAPRKDQISTGEGEITQVWFQQITSTNTVSHQIDSRLIASSTGATRPLFIGVFVSFQE